MARLARFSCPIILGITCFAPILFREHQFGFRDAADFYYPLQLRVQQEWRAGRLPLWEPEENGGVPLLGNPSAAVLYPGKLIYAIFSYPWAARVYVIAHVALAFAAMWIMMHGWNVSPTGASLAALGYAFGGPVLLQYCNVIFLVGAAWMPLAFYHAHRWLELGNRRATGLAGSRPEHADPGRRSGSRLPVCLRRRGTYFGAFADRRGSTSRPQVGIGWPGCADCLSEPSRLQALGRGTGATDEDRLVADRREAGTGWVGRGWSDFPGPLGAKGPGRGMESRLLGLAGACVLALALAAIPLVPSSNSSASQFQGR